MLNQESFGSPENEITELNKEIDILRQKLNSLIDINLLVANAVDPKTIFEKVLEQAIAITEAGSGSLMIAEDDHLRIMAFKGLDPEIASSSRPKMGEGIAGWVAQSGQPLLLVGGGKKVDEARRMIKDALSVPMRSGEETVGVLNVNNSPLGKTFTQEDLELLTAFASQASLALKMLRNRDELEMTYISAIEALAEAIDAKDPYTAGHSRRVSEYATSLGRLLNVDEAGLKMIALAALMHDIGKIGISEEILRKQDRLSSDEYGLIKTHPVIGAKILESVSSLKDAVPMIRHHHERFDGTGYPAGLRGEEIPLGARIIAVIDAFDAMASGRSYRKIMDFKQIVENLRDNSGNQLDPQVLDAFITGIESGDISLRSAVIAGQLKDETPVNAEDVKSDLSGQTMEVLGAIRNVTQSVLDEIEKTAGLKLKSKIGQSLAIAAAQFNLDPIFEQEEIAEAKSDPEKVLDDIEAYFSEMRTLLKEVIGPRLTDRLLVDAVSELPKDDSRLIAFMMKASE